MSVEVYAFGSITNIVVPDTQSIAVSAIGDNPATVYQSVGAPNIPPEWRLLGTVQNTETVFGPYSPAALIRIDAGANPVYYEVGASPVVGEPIGNQVFGVTPGSVTGLSAAQGGSAAIVGGTSTTSGNAGGAAIVRGGVPGATGVGGAAQVVGAAGGSTSGKGGAATVTGGAGTAGNGAGGSTVITPGAAQGSGLAGGNFLRSAGGLHFRQQAAAIAKADGNVSVTGAQIINGIVLFTVTTGRTLTTPTGAAILAACPSDIAAGDSFTFTIITIGTGADDIATLTAGDGDVTFAGNVTVGPDSVTNNNYGTWRFRYTGTTAFVGYRIG